MWAKDHWFPVNLRSTETNDEDVQVAMCMMLNHGGKHKKKKKKKIFHSTNPAVRRCEDNVRGALLKLNVVDMTVAAQQ